MSEEQPAPPSAPLPLPGNSNPDLDPQTLDHRLFEAARAGDVGALAALLDKHPDHLSARTKPYEWTLLHLAARHPAAVDLLLRRGLDVNAREKGDNTCAM